MRNVCMLAATFCALAIAPVHAETVVIEAGQYLDGVQGRLVSPAVIVVEGDRIAAINPAVRPAGARTIDLRKHTLLPGLMDSHTHLNYDIVDGWETEAVRYTTGDFTARVAQGDTPLNAIRSATIVNAELFGTPDRGRIETGLLADLIAVAGNPLEEIRLLEDVRFVMKGGVIYKQPE